MKKQLRVAAMALAMTGSGIVTAQDYINSLTVSGITSVVQANWNSNNTNPEGLYTYPSGFAILTFNETNGSVTNASAVTIDTKYKPDCTAPGGASEMVIGHTNTNIYYTYTTTNTGGVTYCYYFSRTQLSITNITPIDVVYDGSTYYYVLCSATYPPGVNVFATFKITAATGAMSNIFCAITGGNDNFFPDDLEYVDNTHIYASGTHTNTSTGSKTFYLACLGSTPTVVCGTDFPYSTHSTTPGHMYVKYYSTTGDLYLVADMTTGTSATPLVLIDVTPGASCAYTVNSASVYSYNMMNIASVDLHSSSLVVGSANSINTLPLNFLYNVGTNTVTNIYSYSTNGGNKIPQSIFSPSSSRIFSELHDASTTTPYDLRTIANSAATTACSNSVSYTSGSVSITPASVSTGNKYDTPTKTLVSLNSVSPTKSYTQQCASAPIVTRPGGPASRAIASEAHALISPNPASDDLFISSENKLQSVMLFDMSGRVVAEEKINDATELHLSVSGLSPGIYLATIRYADGSMQQEKIMVAKH